MCLSNIVAQSMKDLIEEHKDMIFRICRAYAVQPIEPQDLFQDVVIQILRSLPKFKGESKLSTWIYRITLNTCLRAKERSDKRQDVIQLNEIKIVSHGNEQPEFQDEFDALQQCMFELPDADRSILIFSLEGLSYREISEITGMTENHIAVKMKRIREKMHRCITSRLEKEEGI